jgi:hypothetical protein
MGHNAGHYNVTGTNNTYIGKNAGVGANAKSNSNNTGVGWNALLAITTGSNNTALGYRAGIRITHGSQNICIGNGANAFVDGGHYNIGIGNNANGGVTLASYNIAIGNSSGGDSSATGNRNTSIGSEAGYHLNAGGNNLLLGYQAGSTSAPGDEIDSEDNQIVLGNDSITHAHIKVDWTVSSDGRDKTDIEDFTAGLDFVNQMRPVTYRWDNRSWYVEEKVDDDGVSQVTKEDIMSAVPDGSKKKDKINLGFIAQEVQAIERQVGYSGVKEDGSANRDNELVVGTSADGSSLSLNYPRLVPILVNAIQELSEQVTDLKKEIEELKS